MNKRFSKQVLFELRNHVPIRELIQNELNIAHRRGPRFFRFQCPDCHGFHTSVQREINLARCFDCQKNYNPIDMVMAVMKMEFYESASFLLPILDKIKRRQTSEKIQPVPDRTHQAVNVRNDAGPVSLGDVLYKARALAGGKQDCRCRQCDGLERKIQSMEDDLEKLEKRVQQLYRFTIDGMTPKKDDHSSTGRAHDG